MSLFQTPVEQTQKMQSQILTNRLSLDLLTENDHPFIRTLVNTKGWLQFIGDRNVHSEEDAVAYIRRLLNTPDLFYWVVQKQDDATPLGVITLLKRSYLEHFDLGFAFLPEFTGQGYAFEAAHKLLSVVSKMKEHDAILAITIPQNVSSIRLLTKLGFVFEKEIAVANEQLHVYKYAGQINAKAQGQIRQTPIEHQLKHQNG